MFGPTKLIIGVGPKNVHKGWKRVLSTSFSQMSWIKKIGLGSTNLAQNDFFSSIFQIDISSSATNYVIRNYTICDYKIITFS